MAGRQPFFVSNPSHSWGVLSGGMINQTYPGGKSYPNPQGGASHHVPSGLSYGQPYLGVPSPTWGPQGKQLYPPHGSNLYPSQGDTTHPLMEKLFTPLK
jgi:hypothetical protein